MADIFTQTLFKILYIVNVLVLLISYTRILHLIRIPQLTMTLSLELCSPWPPHRTLYNRRSPPSCTERRQSPSPGSALRNKIQTIWALSSYSPRAAPEQRNNKPSATVEILVCSGIAVPVPILTAGGIPATRSLVFLSTNKSTGLSIRSDK